MINLTPHVPIYIFHEIIDFRCGIDKLITIVQRLTEMDPYSGTLFMFRNRQMSSAKLLLYDGTGFWLYQKRLSEGRFAWWPGELESSKVDHNQVQMLLQGLDARHLKTLPWREIKAECDGLIASKSQNRSEVRSGRDRRPS